MSGEAVANLLAGQSTFVVGIEDDPDGGLRVFLGHRSRGLYCVIDDAAAIEQIRAMWESKMPFTIPIPPPNFIFEEAGS